MQRLKYHAVSVLAALAAVVVLNLGSALDHHAETRHNASQTR